MTSLKDDQIVSRYLPYDRLLGATGLLESRKLYLPKLGDQHDRLEGLPTEATKNNIFRGEEAQGNPIWIPYILLSVQGIMSRQITYVSCWTTSAEPEIRRAEEYGNSNVIITTTVGKIREILPSTAKIRRVLYVDESFDQHRIDMDAINFSKRSSFSWENEVRIIDYRAQTGGLLKKTLDSAPDHLEYVIDPGRFISKIIILPNIERSKKEKVLCFADRYEINVELHEFE